MISEQFKQSLLKQPNHYVKSHGLGNEYIVVNQKNITFMLDADRIKKLCDVHFGIGADGILLNSVVPQDLRDKVDFNLRIFNSDGSEAEKSGNGLRIFCKYLYDYDYTSSLGNPKQFKVLTKGGVVSARIMETNRYGYASVVEVEMGRASFHVNDAFTKEVRDILNASSTSSEGSYSLSIKSAGNVIKEYEITPVSLGNPHFVIIMKEQAELPSKSLLEDEVAIEEVKKYGELISKRYNVNVQFVEVILSSVSGNTYANALIFERGVGFTLASGSSACAISCVLRKKKLIKTHADIRMIGGHLKIDVSDDFDVKMIGPVKEVSKGALSEEFIK